MPAYLNRSTGTRQFGFMDRRYSSPYIRGFSRGGFSRPSSVGFNTYGRYTRERGSPGWRGNRNLKNYIGNGWGRASLGYRGNGSSSSSSSTIASSRLTGSQTTDAMEMKCKHNYTATYTVEETSLGVTFKCLNDMDLGTAADERLGRAVCLHSVNGIGYVEQRNSAFQMTLVRVIIVQSRRAGGQAPTWGNLFSAETTLSHRNLNSTGLYKVHFDVIMPVVGVSMVPSRYMATSSSYVSGVRVRPGFTFRYVIDLQNAPTNYLIKLDAFGEPVTAFALDQLVDNGIFFGAAYYSLDGGMIIDKTADINAHHYSQLFFYDI